MTEPEASIHFALYFIYNGLTSDDVQVSIDGAHIRTKDTIYFDIANFMSSHGILKADENHGRWQGEYLVPGHREKLRINSKPGVGDIVVKLKTGCIIVAECKKGKQNKSGQEYPLMREAVGQLMTSNMIDSQTRPIVVVPYSEKSHELALRWSEYPQIKQVRIEFALVHDQGEIEFV